MHVIFGRDQTGRSVIQVGHIATIPLAIVVVGVVAVWIGHSAHKHTPESVTSVSTLLTLNSSGYLKVQK